MIEINLLPEGIRTTEGTPPRRFALYIGFLMLLLGLGFYIGKYIKVEIPNMNQKIQLAGIEKENLIKKQKEVDEITTKIDQLNKKIADLDDLNLSRVRFARLFDRLTNAIPEGVWFRSFTVAPDSSVSLRYLPAGRRYAITMSGNSVGATNLERNHKFTELLSNLEKQFNIPPESAPPPSPLPDEYGFCKFIGARFERPIPSGISTATISPLKGMDEKILKQINAPKEGADFTVKIVFDMPAPKSQGN